MSYRIAGIDVHKKMLAVVVADVEVEGEYEFERRRYGSNPEQLRVLAEWLLEQAVEEVVMESTAQYWKPVWGALERYWQATCRKREGAGPMSGALHLAQALSNRGRRGRKKDFPDAERLVKRLVAQELTLSFVPDSEQRLWRTVMRRKYQLTCNRVQLHNRLESLLEEAHLKLSSLVSDLLGASARRMLKAIADGETNPAALAALADKRLRATQEQLRDALSACTDEDDAGGVAIPRTADQPSRPRERKPAEPAYGCCAPAGGGPRFGRGFSAADPGRSGGHGSDVSFGEAPFIVGWRMLRRRRERGGVHEPPLPERQPPHAAYSQSMCQRRGQGQRKHLRDRVSPLGAAPGTQANHRGDCPSALPADLDNFASRGPL